MHFFLLWCLRPPAGDDVPVGDYLLLVALGWWWRGARRGRDGERGVGRGGGWPQRASV
jgi:hypothetical protein